MNKFATLSPCLLACFSNAIICTLLCFLIGIWWVLSQENSECRGHAKNVLVDEHWCSNCSQLLFSSVCFGFKFLLLTSTATMLHFFSNFNFCYQRTTLEIWGRLKRLNVYMYVVAFVLKWTSICNKKTFVSVIIPWLLPVKSFVTFHWSHIRNADLITWNFGFTFMKNDDIYCGCITAPNQGANVISTLFIKLFFS